MLNPFPIQYLALLAYFILRFGIGAILIHLSINHYSERKSIKEAFAIRFGRLNGITLTGLILGELIIGSMLLLGVYTQYAAIALLCMSTDLAITRNLIAHPSIPQRIFYVLLIFCSLSIFITGAGAFAVDLPL